MYTCAGQVSVYYYQRVAQTQVFITCLNCVQEYLIATTEDSCRHHQGDECDEP